jgi:hypothetical protein
MDFFASIRDGYKEGLDITRGRMGHKCSFDPARDERLTKENSTALAWATILRIRRMAGPDRAHSLVMYGQRWWDQEMLKLNHQNPKMFGNLPTGGAGLLWADGSDPARPKDDGYATDDGDSSDSDDYGDEEDGGGGGVGGGGGGGDNNNQLHAVARARSGKMVY